MSQKKRKQERRKHSAEFKQEAVRLVLLGEKSQAEIASDLGISPFTLSNWKTQFLSRGDEVGSNLSPQAEIKKLKRELEITRSERDILKKVVAVFSRPRQ